ncbi:HAD family hydrolase [Christensenellaceae bacterium OttesenSCG-928-L17]|nr:HAD family hydrolase [Christensenellaceae bacterium OttesenSCG-928-L17]
MIKTMLFDMGGTLEDLYYDRATLLSTASRIQEMLAARGIACSEDTETLADKAEAGLVRYKREVSEKYCIEYKPEQIWPQYILGDTSVDTSLLDQDFCEELAAMWELTYFQRNLREGVAEALQGIQSLGIRMGVISNTCSIYQVFDVLENYGIRQYFENVTLSSVTGYRKPQKRIFEIALREMGADASTAAYAGDTLSRDVVGPRNAGFALTFQIKSFLTASRDADCIGKVQADYEVTSIREIYEILRDLQAGEEPLSANA